MSAVATINDSVKNAARALDARSDSPRLDAEILLAKVLGLPRSALLARADEPLDAQSESAYLELLRARAAGTPVAYLTGTREFWSLPLSVSPAVLVPRPETECLIEQALRLLPREGKFRALDLGTGSGAIALALSHERPHCDVTGVDVSSDALEVAAGNARALGLARVHWRLGDWFDAVPGERFHIILANPPYIAAADPALASLAAEPTLALTPGPTGLEALQAIIERAPAHLHLGGWLALEHGSDQAPQVARLLELNGFDSIHTQVDFSGRPRVTLGVHTQH